VTLWNAAQDVSQTLGLKWPRIDPKGNVFWTRNGIFEVACNFRGLEVGAPPALRRKFVSAGSALGVCLRACLAARLHALAAPLRGPGR
jgi:hypothetical protein